MLNLTVIVQRSWGFALTDRKVLSVDKK